MPNFCQYSLDGLKCVKKPVAGGLLYIEYKPLEHNDSLVEVVKCISLGRFSKKAFLKACQKYL